MSSQSGVQGKALFFEEVPFVAEEYNLIFEEMCPFLLVFLTAVWRLWQVCLIACLGVTRSFAANERPVPPLLVRRCINHAWWYGGDPCPWLCQIDVTAWFLWTLFETRYKWRISEGDEVRHRSRRLQNWVSKKRFLFLLCRTAVSAWINRSSYSGTPPMFNIELN